MNIHEYQAKELLRQFAVPVPFGIMATTHEEANVAAENILHRSPVVVVKAQIHAGGRGKGGGVKIAKNQIEAKEYAKNMLGMTLVTHQTGPDGQLVRRLYLEEGAKILHEYYLSLVLDRQTSSIIVVASTEGGMDIEEVAAAHPEKIVKARIHPAIGLESYTIRKITFALGLNTAQSKSFANILRGLYNLFISKDANQVEINPLVLTENDQMIALDAKINFDSNALYRQPDIASLRDTDEEDPLEVEAAKFDLNYIKMQGNIGCMVNGAGLAMSTMDIIKLYGGEPANFLDVGGGATKEKVKEAFKIILSDSGVKAILVNIFGGIMRCDIIADGVISAAREIGITIPVVVRLAGTNAELGQKMLDESGLSLISATDLADAAAKVVKTLA